MTSNIVNFPIIPRATAIAPEDESDPHTAAIEGIKKAIETSIQKCGKAWTLNVLRSAIEIDDKFSWRERARALLDRKETQV
jgi:hypothetical protein